MLSTPDDIDHAKPVHVDRSTERPALIWRIDLANEAFATSFRANLSVEETVRKFLPQFLKNKEGDPLPRIVITEPLDKTTEKPLSPPPPKPLPAGKEASFYDGAFIGAYRDTYPATESRKSIPPVTPYGGPPVPERVQEFPNILYINGITTTLERACSNIQRLAVATNSPIIGIYNATDSERSDILQSIGDKVDIGNNKAFDTLRKELLNALTGNERLHIVGESHGALIVSRAIGTVKKDLLTIGWSEKEITDKLANISVETFGGCAWTYPDGPRYVHYINQLDPVPLYFGLGPYGQTSAETSYFEHLVEQPKWMKRLTTAVDVLDVDYIAERSPGAGGKIVRFSSSNKKDWVAAHCIETYTDYRQPFEKAYNETPPSAPAPFEPQRALNLAIKWWTVAGLMYIAASATKRFANKVRQALKGEQSAA